jgi:protein-disulfide isomerase
MMPAEGPDSLRAAEATLCAGDQGKFWEYRNTLYTYYFREGLTAYSAEELLKAARELGLDMEAFTACLENEVKKPEVEANMQRGQEAGVTGTPTVFINGVEVPEGATAKTYLAMVDAQLAQ